MGRLKGYRRIHQMQAEQAVTPDENPDLLVEQKADGKNNKKVTKSTKSKKKSSK